MLLEKMVEDEPELQAMCDYVTKVLDALGSEELESAAAYQFVHPLVRAVPRHETAWGLLV